MSKKLRLKPTGSKFRLRINAFVLLVIILVSLFVGYITAQQGLITGKAALNCIPQNDFQFFLDEANEV